MPIWFDTDEELDAAVADVAALSPAARRVLSEAIESQGKRISVVSRTVEALEGLGFLFIREDGPYSTGATISPSLWGEEALDAYETRREGARKPKDGGLRAPGIRPEPHS